MIYFSSFDTKSWLTESSGKLLPLFSQKKRHKVKKTIVTDLTKKKHLDYRELCQTFNSFFFKRCF